MIRRLIPCRILRGHRDITEVYERVYPRVRVYEYATLTHITCEGACMFGCLTLGGVGDTTDLLNISVHCFGE
jgi:hypothetical protein